jgi:hypothetical protein
MTTARAAVNVLEAYGYSAKQFGCDVVTDCPTLLAIPAIQKRVGFAEIERLDLRGGKLAPELTAEFFPAPPPARPHQGSGSPPEPGPKTSPLDAPAPVILIPREQQKYHIHSGT